MIFLIAQYILTLYYIPWNGKCHSLHCRESVWYHQALHLDLAYHGWSDKDWSWGIDKRCTRVVHIVECSKGLHDHPVWHLTRLHRQIQRYILPHVPKCMGINLLDRNRPMYRCLRGTRKEAEGDEIKCICRDRNVNPSATRTQQQTKIRTSMT